MDEAKVKEILEPNVFSEDGGLFYDLGWYLAWDTNEKDACLDGRFSPDKLEAIAWWMRHKFKV